MKITFEVNTEPVPQARPRVTRNGTYEPQRCTNFKRMVKLAALEAMDTNPPLKGEISCLIRVFRKLQPSSRRFGDADNLAKGVMDALNGVCFLDDAQISTLVLVKSFSNLPHVEILLIDEVLDWQNLISLAN